MGTLRADFSGEVAVVTGGASGLGASIASTLVESGARVHVFDRRKAPAEFAERMRFHELDLTSSRAIDSAIVDVLRAEGRIDHLINNAGVTRDGVLWKLADEAWDEVLDTNLGAAFRMLRAVVPSMRKAGRGSIVQVSSINGMRAKFGQSNYCASKAGLIALTKTAARELGSFGIRVNTVAPGMIQTEMTRTLPAEVLERALAESALGRIGAPRDVTGAVLYLLSESASHVTGTVLCVDGGQTA